MFNGPSTGELAYSEARDNSEAIKIIQKRLDLCRRVLSGEKMTAEEFQKAWEDAVPKPPPYVPIDYSKIPGFKPASLLGDYKP